MAIFKLGGAGSWCFRSKTDKRWNIEGRADFMMVTGGLHGCNPARDKYDEMVKEYGEPPEDLEYSCMKD